MKRIVFVYILLFATSCTEKNNEAQLNLWRQEISEAENSFCKLVKDEGNSKAFLEFAAEDAVLMRNNTFVAGRDQIKSYLLQVDEDPSQSLVWEPEFIDVSSSGDRGYTYGKFVYTFKDSLGNSNESKGVFHTVWKRQIDGLWKFVWD